METKQFNDLNEKLLTPEEYSEKEKIPLRTVYYRMKNGVLKTTKFKGKKLIDLR